MPISVRLDPEEERLVRRIAKRRKTTVSDVIRDAVSYLAEEEQKKPIRPYDQIADLIGIVSGGPPDLSERTGEKFRKILLEKAKRWK